MATAQRSKDRTDGSNGSAQRSIDAVGASPDGEMRLRYSLFYILLAVNLDHVLYIFLVLYMYSLIYDLSI